MITERKVIYDNISIKYTLERKQVKNINLRIHNNGCISVSANPAVPETAVDEFIIKKAEYIKSAQKKFRQIEEYQPAPKNYVSGESFSISGRSLRLKVERSETDTVYSDGFYIFLKVKNPDDIKTKEKLTSDFIKSESLKIFTEVINEIYPVFKKYGVPYPELRIRNMQTRWGSCLSKKGIITLNSKLIEAPKNCIQYVVTHEFCHFIHPDHSKRFYNLLTMLMPDWKERKELLEKTAVFGL